MDLNTALSQINTEPREFISSAPIVKNLPSNEVQDAINRLCFEGMRYEDLISVIGKLTTGGIPFEELLENVSFIEQYIAPDSSTNEKGVEYWINHLYKSYPDQVGTSATSSIPADCFSEAVYKNLPEQLKQICYLINEPRKRDVCLIGLIVAASAAFSRWRFTHGAGSDVKEYSPHLLAYVGGAASSGKGMTRYSEQLVALIADDANRKGKQSALNYRMAKQQYDSEVKKRAKDNTPLDELTEPAKPVKYRFQMSASDTTQAALVEILHQNPTGGFAYEAEADTLIQGNAKKDFGGFSDTLRKVFHHETLSRQRKGADESYDVKEPRLAFILSGTHDQLKKLIRSEENGLFSRLWYYILPPVEDGYKKPEQQRDIIGEAVQSIQQEIRDNADLWGDDLNYITFTDQQEDDLFNAMQDKQEVSRKYGGDISASWNRMGLIVKRIAVTLAALQGATNVVPGNCWIAAMGLLPAIKAHAIQSLNLIRENQGKVNISKAEYEQLKTAGMSEQQIATILNVSNKTLQRRRKEWGYKI